MMIRPRFRGVVVFVVAVVAVWAALFGLGVWLFG